VPEVSDCYLYVDNCLVSRQKLVPGQPNLVNRTVRGGPIAMRNSGDAWLCLAFGRAGPEAAPAGLPPAPLYPAPAPPGSCLGEAGDACRADPEIAAGDALEVAAQKVNEAAVADTVRAAVREGALQQIRGGVFCPVSSGCATSQQLSLHLIFVPELERDSAKLHSLF
jgi:hypothetical protein